MGNQKKGKTIDANLIALVVSKIVPIVPKLYYLSYIDNKGRSPPANKSPHIVPQYGGKRNVVHVE